jgi:GDP-mannose 6-dehydrogenase
MTSAVSVFGLGYVGCVSAACFANEGHEVIGVDVSADKVSMVNAGRATIVEEGIGELVAQMVREGRLRATTSVTDAIAASQISLICVGTPSRPNGSLDLAYVERVAADIGRALRDVGHRHTIVVRSTVLPGTTDTIVRTILERESGKTSGVDFDVCMNPEFLREGTSIKDFYDPPFTVIGAASEDAARPVASLYRGVNAPVRVVATRVAELLKYACNCYHGLKVAFANEIGNLGQALGVDSHEVMSLFCEDTKLNISPAYLRPGYAFGGSCLPKDLRAAIHRARSADVQVPVLEAILESNQRQIEKASAMVLATGSRRVGVLGLSFKAGTDDLRESPMVTLIETLIGKGLQLAIYDPDVSNADVMGTNRAYIEREIPHIWSLMRTNIRDTVSDAEVLIVGKGLPEVRELVADLDGRLVIDLVRAFGRQAPPAMRYQGICW